MANASNDAQPMQIPGILIEQLLPLWHRDTKKGEEHATRPGGRSLGVGVVLAIFLFAFHRGLLALV